jgi:hypothetical protein
VIELGLATGVGDVVTYTWNEAAWRGEGTPEAVLATVAQAGRVTRLTAAGWRT